MPRMSHPCKFASEHMMRNSCIWLLTSCLVWCLILTNNRVKEPLHHFFALWLMKEREKSRERRPKGLRYHFGWKEKREEITSNGSTSNFRFLCRINRWPVNDIFVSFLLCFLFFFIPHSIYEWFTHQYVILATTNSSNGYNVKSLLEAEVFPVSLFTCQV